MNRRQYLALALPLLAGCSTDSTSSPSDSDPNEGSESDPIPGSAGVSGVELDSADVQAEEADVSLEIAFNSYTSTELTPGEHTTIAEDGNKWVVVRMDVTNTGDAERDLAAHQYVLEADGETYEVVAFREHFLGEMAASAGETVTGWISFHVPIGTEAATLTVDQSALIEQLDVSFTHDSSLAPAFP